MVLFPRLSEEKRRDEFWLLQKKALLAGNIAGQGFGKCFKLAIFLWRTVFTLE